IILTSYTPAQAFEAVDWNVIAILLGMWLITAYLTEAGFAEATIAALTRYTKNASTLIALLALTAGFVSIFVDNVLVILLFGSLVIKISKAAGFDPLPAILLVGFSANFMGTAMLMGDLPPQLLHSVAGLEFMDFIWLDGKPSSFPLLTVTFIVVTVLYTRFVTRKWPRADVDLGRELGRVNKPLLAISLAFFVATVVGMALRPRLGVPLGFITMVGATALALTVEVLRRRMPSFPSFEKVISSIEWRALLFYAALFSLVGGLESSGVIERAAELLLPYVGSSLPIAYTVLYWGVAALALVVEHDALLLTFLYLVRDAAWLAGVEPLPIYLAMAWSATLASNATTSAAPALYVAVTMAEKERRKVSPREFLKYSLPYVAMSLALQYAISLPIWGI
ncbi:MAG: SLC13 family permease, partial [Pyrodictiaceae archaeon]